MFFLFVCLFVEYVFVFTMPRLICSHWWVETSSSFLLIYCNVKKGVRPLWCSSCWEDIAFKSDVFISRVICVCVCAPTGLSVIMKCCMLQRSIWRETVLFSLGSCFTECTFSSFCSETQKHDDRSSSKRHTVYHYQETPLPSVCFVQCDP